VDIPDKLMDHMRNGPLSAQLNLDNKLKSREKAIARQKFDKDLEEEFFRRTGIRNTSEDFKLENLMNKYEYDMEKFKLEDKKKRRLMR
jgi:hypothetical protein